MKPFKLVALGLAIFLCQQISIAQEKSTVKFGKITPADFNLPAGQFDSGAAAVVIADIGNSEFEGNKESSFSIIFNHFKRVKILNKSGMDAATVEIPLYYSGNREERLLSLKAVTYNLEDGKVVQTKLDDQSIFIEKDGKNLKTKKFTFPAVKEGSIIEFSYTQSSDFLFNLQPWAFQGRYPVLWSEYEVSIPEYFTYVFLAQGYQPFTFKNSSTRSSHFMVHVGEKTGRDEVLNLDGTSNVTHWLMKNVPALKEEKYTTTLANHISKIEFQLSIIQYPNQGMHTYMSDWLRVSEQLMDDEEFGADLDKNNSWLDDDLRIITAGTTDKLEKTRKIFVYVRDHFKSTESMGTYMDKPLKTVFKDKGGNDASINLLLIAMLRHEKIDADPIILSTRHHGYTSEIYPIMGRFNYTICAASIDINMYFIESSQPKLGFGFLPGYCYNGHARLINKTDPKALYFDADNLNEGKITSIMLYNDSVKAGKIYGGFQSSLGFVESYDFRETYSEKGAKEIQKEIKSSYLSDVDIKNIEIDSLDKLESPIQIHYDFTFTNNDEDIIYFNPFLLSEYKENPFASAERKYPVEMPYKTSDTYILNMEIPKGYQVVELPKSAKVTFNESDGYFEYLIASDEDNIQLRSHIQINRANFTPEEYNSLRDFYTFIVKKQAEQIVFKKKK